MEKKKIFNKLKKIFKIVKPLLSKKVILYVGIGLSIIAIILGVSYV